MRYFVIICMLLFAFSLSAQKQTFGEREKNHLIYDHFLRLNIQLYLNDQFMRSTDMAFKTYDGVELVVLHSAPAFQHFDQVQEKVKKGKKIKGDGKRWQQLENYKILKAVEISEKQGKCAEITYDIYFEDINSVRIIVLLKQSQLEEWEEYFDWVAINATVQK